MSALSLHLRHHPDLQFTVSAMVHEHYVDFAIYDIDGWVGDQPQWPKAGSTFSGYSVDALADAAVYLHGSVKWDGCSNWHFDEQDRVRLHGCSRADVQRFGDIMARCWDWTAELCPKWDTELNKL